MTVLRTVPVLVSLHFFYENKWQETKECGKYSNRYIYRDRERESRVGISGIYVNHKNMPNYGFGHSRVRVYNCACDRKGVLVGLVLIN